MMRSMFTGVSGLRSHQLMMDVVGDNIANINTPGFKGSRVMFQDTLSQALRGGASASNGQGGVNPQQVGLGVRVAAIETVSTQGPTQNTGRPTDVAIQGEGFFVVRAGGEQLYTRAGSFGFDNVGNLSDPMGAIVQGWLADPTTGVLPVDGPPTDIRLPLGQSIEPVVTTTVAIGGNLSANTRVGAPPVQFGTEVIDSLGSSRRVNFALTKADDNTWTLQPTDEDGAGIGDPVALQFDGATGTLRDPGALSFTLPGRSGATDTTFTLDFGAPGSAAALTQFGGSNSARPMGQDGSPTGYLRSFAIADDGTISGVFSNGRSQVLGQLAIAGFTNPTGLVKAGSSHLRAAAGSGAATIGVPGEQGRGTFAAGSLEMSNVELAQEFTNLMIAQRGFQANSRIISTSDEMLQELVNIKR